MCAKILAVCPAYTVLTYVPTHTYLHTYVCTYICDFSAQMCIYVYVDYSYNPVFSTYVCTCVRLTVCKYVCVLG